MCQSAFILAARMAEGKMDSRCDSIGVSISGNLLNITIETANSNNRSQSFGPFLTTHWPRLPQQWFIVLHYSSVCAAATAMVAAARVFTQTRKERGDVVL